MNEKNNDKKTKEQRLIKKTKKIMKREIKVRKNIPDNKTRFLSAQ